MFKATDNQEKLENMNIDDVLEHAEDHDTTENLGGAQLGGEDFLRQFEIADYKADVSWDDIIPKEDRERIEEEERALQEQRATEELIAMNSRRIAALSKRLNPGDTESIASEEPERKRRKLPIKKNVVKKKPEIDVDRELDVNDIRHLYNGMKRFGDLEGRYSDIVAGTDLSKLNEDNVRQIGEELYEACLQAVKNQSLEKPDAEISAPIEPTADGESKTKGPPQKKAVLIEFKGLQKVNAESILQRRDDMTFLHHILHRTSPVTNFRISSQVKAVMNWKCQWAVKEDAMLLIGVDKYGQGGWHAIRDDAELGLVEKFFLDEKRIEKRSGKPEGASKDIPGSIHLSRRTDYLINVLREEHRKPGILDILSGKTVETPVKEPKGRARVSNSKSSSKRTTNGDVEPSHDKKRRISAEHGDDSVRQPRKATPGRDSSKSNAQTKPAKKHVKEEPLSEYESMDEAELKVSSHLCPWLTSRRT
jgi:chromodomain-helicase-DNA-binding protein 1